MLDRKKFFFFCCLIIVSCVFGVDSDYYYGKSLRTQVKKNCYSGLYESYCRIKCGLKSSLCLERHCYCVYYVQNLKKIDSPQVIYLAKPDEPLKEINLSDDIGDNAAIDYLDEPHVKDQMMFSLRPSLRHHIAHFCPNLKVAKQCIQTCMKEGKPAFCGKDHVCYCGHKYSNTDDAAANVEEMYGQFHDLYEKYFGTSSNIDHEKD